MSAKDHLTFDDTDAPERLPAVKAKRKRPDPVALSRKCDKCSGESVRVQSNFQERRAWCNNCGHNWAISMATSMVVRPEVFDRGLSKQTLVEPDWNLAYEDLDEWPDEDNPDG